MILYDADKGTLLGRSAGSWAKILGFYLIYYTFLAGLMYVFVTQYQAQLPVPGGVTSKITTRLDQPGTAAFPFATIPDAIDGADNSLTLDVGSKTKSAKAYKDKFLKFAESYQAAKTAGKDAVCAESGDAKTKTCSVKNADLITADAIDGWVSDRKPVVALAMNKVIDWKPINYKKSDDIDTSFEKNAVYVKCYEVSVAGKKIEDSKFQIDYLGDAKDQKLMPEYFPYTGLDKHDKLAKDTEYLQYNKPFVLVQISSKEGSTSAWDVIPQDKSAVAPSYFNCYWQATNINTPAPVLEWDKPDNAEIKAWSMEMEKMSLGITKFSIKYEEADAGSKAVKTPKPKAASTKVETPETDDGTTDTTADTKATDTPAV